MPKVSIIVPVFNSRNTLNVTLDAIVRQTLDEVEIVVVDDHSTDDSMAVLQRYVASYYGPKTFVIAQTSVGKGPGAARNTGLDFASGEYVAFVDSDDIIDPFFCVSLYSAASRVKADLAFCDIQFDFPNGSSTIRQNPSVADGVFEQAAKRAYLRHYTTFFTTYLYRKSFLDSFAIRFPLTRSAEDSCFLCCCLLSAQSIASVKAPLYHYIIRHNSVSKKKDPLRYRQKLESFRKLREFAKNHGFYRPYRVVLEYVIFKKGILGALRELMSN